MRVCMPHVCPHIWPMYARIHAPLLPPYGPYMRPCMPYCCPHIWPMYARMHAPLLPPYGPYMRPCMPYCCSHIWPIYARMHAPLLLPCGPYMRVYMAMYARIYPPLSGTKIRTIRKAVEKRQALYLIWTSLLVLVIYSL